MLAWIAFSLYAVAIVIIITLYDCATWYMHLNCCIAATIVAGIAFLVKVISLEPDSHVSISDYILAVMVAIQYIPLIIIVITSIVYRIIKWRNKKDAHLRDWR
jgi:hypothetical protein